MWTPIQVDLSIVKATYTFEPHAFGPLKGFTKPVCTRCGLLALNNDLTRWAVSMGCEWDAHPQFKAMRLRYTRM